MATNINNKLVCNEPHANLDSYYGPYNTVHAAYVALADTTVNGINYTKKHIGLTVGVWKDSSHTEIVEYWFKGGLSESNLVEKTSDAGLPGGVKIVTFDKNGGSGVQNSILTDTNSQVKLPECTFTKSGETFTKWSYNGTQKNPGDIITIGSATVVQAVWSSTKPSHKITWSAGTGINKITGTVNGVAISSGDNVKEDATIVLTATMNSGYNFSQWSGLPSGTSANNPVSFAMGTSNISVTATAEPTVVKYTIGWSGSNVRINATDGNDTPLTNGSQYASGTTVKMTAQADAGYDFEKWEGVPNSVADPTQSSITFTLDNDYQNIVAKTKATPVESGFYYYGCGSTNGAKGNITGSEGEGESGNEGGTTTKWFTIEEIMRGEVKSDSVSVKDTDGNTIYYVLTKTNTKPTYTVDGETKDFVELQKCGNNEIINHFNSLNWVFAETNQITGKLQTQTGCNYIFIVINELLKNKTFTISI